MQLERLLADDIGSDGNYVKGIEDYLPRAQYETEDHKRMVVTYIIDNWMTLSHNIKFHAIFVTSSIPEAICYYRMIKEAMPTLEKLKILAFKVNIKVHNLFQDYILKGGFDIEEPAE